MKSQRVMEPNFELSSAGDDVTKRRVKIVLSTSTTNNNKDKLLYVDINNDNKFYWIFLLMIGPLSLFCLNRFLALERTHATTRARAFKKPVFSINSSRDPEEKLQR